MHKTASYASLGLLAIAIVQFGAGRPEIAGPLLTAFFALAAFGVRAIEKLRGISFSLLIFAAVSLAMNYPAPFVSWGDFGLDALIVPLLQIIMFGMGTAMSARDFVGVVKAPKAVFIGLGCQFTIMPFVGAGLALAFDLEPEIAAGIVLIGAAPSGLASNVMAYIGKANLALSVTLTTVATLLAPLVTPFYMQWLAGQLIPIDTWGMMWSIIRITILPIMAGLIFNHFLHGKTDWLDRLMPKVSMAGIAVILMIMTAGGRDWLVASRRDAKEPTHRGPAPTSALSALRAALFRIADAGARNRRARLCGTEPANGGYADAEEEPSGCRCGHAEQDRPDRGGAARIAGLDDAGDEDEDADQRQECAGNDSCKRCVAVADRDVATKLGHLHGSEPPLGLHSDHGRERARGGIWDLGAGG